MRHFAALGPDVVDRVLDDVERRRFLVDPAGENAVELALRVAHVELHERAGQLLHFPGRGGFAGPEADDHAAGLDRLARLHLELAGDAVALVKQAQHRHPFAHRRRARCKLGHCLGYIDGFRLGLGLRVALPLLRLAAASLAAGCKRKQEGSGAGAKAQAAHPWSGVHAS
jgi:hypothetical protein